MNNRKTSKIWKIDKSELQSIIDKSPTFVEVLRFLGFDTENGNHRTLKKRIIYDNINLDKLKSNHEIFLKNKNLTKQLSFDKVFCENSTVKGQGLKKRILKEKLMEYKCSKCFNTGEWQGDKLVLQIEHKNGSNRDNRIENLCFLCPNCHSQTYSGRNSCNKRNKKKYFCECGKEMDRNADRCFECYRKTASKEQLRIPSLTKEDLEKYLKEMPIVKIAKLFNVSDTAIRKYAKRFGIDYKSISPFSYAERL